MTWMVTGGAGYIGAHIVKSLQESGYGVVAFDDLSTGEARKVPHGVPLVEASVVDDVAVEKAIREHDVTGVVHMAAKKAVGESVERPLYYYRENVDGLLSLLEAMDAAGVKKMVYSSSAATFGMPDSDDPLTEDFICQPINPYGETKLIGEWLMRDVATCHRPGLGVAALLQRRRRRGPRPRRHRRLQPDPDGVPRAVDGQEPAGVRLRLPDARTARASATTSTSPTSPTLTSHP